MIMTIFRSSLPLAVALLLASPALAGGNDWVPPVKDPALTKAVATRVAESAERIDRCQVTGEILSGCNRYVSVYHSEECKAKYERILKGDQ